MPDILTPEDAEREIALRELARRHLRDFVLYRFEDYQENWHHRMLMLKLEALARGEIRKLMVFMPPRNGKSELSSINLPPWFFGQNPKQSIIASSYSGDLAVDFGRKARNIMETPEYKSVFPGVFLSDDAKAAGHWITNKGGEYTAVGMGGATTGRGADLFIMDDPVKNMQDAQSIVISETNYDWYRSVARTRLAPQGRMLLIQTRWHDRDLAGRILEEEDDWEIVCLPAIAEDDEEFRSRGDALWPVRFPLEELEKIKKDLGTTIWSALYQQSPINAESQVFKKSMFKYRTLEEVLRLETRGFVTIDPAPGKTENADFIGVTINLVDQEGKWNLIAFKIKFNAMELIKLLFKLDQDYTIEKFGIEQGLYQDVLKPFLDEEMTKRGRFLTIVELKHKQQSKHLRIQGLQPIYEAHAIYHVTGQCKDLEDELLRFPKAAHDDVSDSAAYQPLIAERPIPAKAHVAVAANRRDRTDASRKDAGL